ncbi:MAG: hypothetical protein A2X49_12705 [Lentisphaerae bacterium GWF2_52_8]|nr:MAG: hypothetical protein A2X49_12705 [Lentisphaerae bacterium GWF2_52_8]
MEVDCATPCGSAPCPRKVVEYAPDDIVAVCPEMEKRPYPLALEDILIYSLKHSAFQKDICAAFNLRSDGTENRVCRKTWRIGDLVPVAGVAFPAYITFQEIANDLLDAVRQLCLLHDGHFILMAPTRRRVRPPAEQLLSSRKALFLSLDEELFFDANARLQSVRKPEQVFASLFATLPNPCESKSVFFPTPTGTKWEDVLLHFNDGHRLTICIGEMQKTFTYSEMGMSSRKDGEPTKNWSFLRMLASCDGVLAKADAAGGESLKTRKKELCKVLCEFFRLESEPVFWDDVQKAYVCRFQIRPDTHSTQWRERNDGARQKTGNG